MKKKKVGQSMYELCLEYGTFPISLKTDDFADSQSIPDFLQKEPELLADLMTINAQFHSLFIEIEGNLDFIGRDEPEKISQLKVAYQEITNRVSERFPSIEIAPFYLA
ncbi:hypothetical protein ACVR1I_03695 [Streptococcus cameli]